MTLLFILFFVAVGMLQLSPMFASEPVPKYFLEGGRWYWWWDDELWVWEEVRVFATLLFFFSLVFVSLDAGLARACKLARMDRGGLVAI